LIAGPLGQLVYWDMGQSAGCWPERFSGGMNDRFLQLSQRAGAESFFAAVAPRIAIGQSLDDLVAWFIGHLF